MWIQALMILFGAVLSSAITLGVAYHFFERHYKARLQEDLDQQIDDYQKRFQEVLDGEIQKAGAVIETGVRQGVLDAVSSIPSSEVIQGTTQSVVQTSVGLVEAGLETFLGTKRKS